VRRSRSRHLVASACAVLMICGCGAETDPPRSASVARTITVAHPPMVTSAPAPEPAPEVPVAAPASASPPRKPTIIRMFIPYGAKRKQQMSAYSARHYGVAGYKLTDPRVIVEHVTVTDTVQAAYNTFAANVRDPELHELPGTCAHFVIGTDGRIYQLVPLAIRCRHTVGLNDRSYGIEHVGRTDGQILSNTRQLNASLRLTAWLRCRAGIGVRNVIGHAESLGSRYHHERVAKLKTQTHGDMKTSAMQIYRRKLRTRPCS
jgi:N-acetylmuramoyl-L-alanine amidase